MTSEGTRLQLDRIEASYGSVPVLRGLTLDVREGEMVALLGPSGCGKTTVLKIVAGLVRPVAGSVRFSGKSMERTPAEKRGAAMVFQKPLLFPHMTVAGNVSFGLRMRGMAVADQKRRVSEALEMVRLSGYDSRMPKELSGGQEQRVSLARALVTSPRVLLLDEPFSALDENLRGEMRSLVRGLQRQLGITSIFVTHAQEEASVVVDRIALLLDGGIEQFAVAKKFYTEPRTLRAARFFGWQTLPRGRNGDTRVFRPEAVRLIRDGESLVDGYEPLGEGRLEECVDLGARIRLSIAVDGAGVLILDQVPADQAMLAAGTAVRIIAPRGSIKVFNTNDGETV